MCYLGSQFPAHGAEEKYTEDNTVVQSQFCFQSQLLRFPDGLQRSESLTCLSDYSHNILCIVSICFNFAYHVCKVMNVFEGITVDYGNGVVCLVVFLISLVFVVMN